VAAESDNVSPCIRRFIGTGGGLSGLSASTCGDVGDVGDGQCSRGNVPRTRGVVRASGRGGSGGTWLRGEILSRRGKGGDGGVMRTEEEKCWGGSTYL
jgi:hypothetical protein